MGGAPQQVPQPTASHLLQGHLDLTHPEHGEPETAEHRRDYFK